MIAVGWFGVPGAHSSKSTKTHLLVGGKPACGARVGKRAEFQWCCVGAGVYNCECQVCERKRQKLVKERED